MSDETRYWLWKPSIKWHQVNGEEYAAARKEAGFEKDHALCPAGESFSHESVHLVIRGRITRDAHGSRFAWDQEFMEYFKERA